MLFFSSPEEIFFSAALEQDPSLIEAGIEQLYERVRTFASHMQKMRKGLGSTVDHFSKAVGSLGGRVLVSARKLQDLGAGSGDEIERLEGVERSPRRLQSGMAENDKS